MQMEQMTHEEVKAYFQAGNDMVILPCGSTEQHGKHLPLGTDLLIASHLAHAVGEKGGILVAPSLAYGYAEYHKEGFTGTISFDQDLLYAVYYRIAEQLAEMGAKHIVFLNGHGGNTHVLSRVSMNLRIQHQVLGLIVDWWKTAGQLQPQWAEKGHAGKAETSVMMHLYPDLVHQSQICFEPFFTLADGVETKGSASFSYQGVTYQLWMNTCDVVSTESGSYGEDPHLSSAEEGRQSMEAVVDHLTDFLLHGFQKMHPAGGFR